MENHPYTFFINDELPYDYLEQVHQKARQCYLKRNPDIQRYIETLEKEGLDRFDLVRLQESSFPACEFAFLGQRISAPGEDYPGKERDVIHGLYSPDIFIVPVSEYKKHEQALKMFATKDRHITRWPGHLIIVQDFGKEGPSDLSQMPENFPRPFLPGFKTHTSTLEQLPHLLADLWTQSRQVGRER